MTIRENDCRLNDVSEKYQFYKITFDIVYFQQFYYSAIWRFNQLKFDDITSGQNDDPMK